MSRKTLIILIAFIVAGTFTSCKIFNTGQESKNTVVSNSQLEGNWELNYISGIRIAFNGLYPDTKPSINFNVATNELNGNTSCNVFGSKTTIDGNNISIADPGAMTMRFCEGEGEKRFLDMLKKVNRYDVNDSTLTFIQGDIAIMRFSKK